jgi:ABC-type phosphate transport system permease subunit
MNAHPQLGRVEMIERSLRCFVLGLLGLIPVLGIPMSLMALRQHRLVMRVKRDTWNPAQRYLFWGAVCARMGLCILILASLAIAAIAVIEDRSPIDDCACSPTCQGRFCLFLPLTAV